MWFIGLDWADEHHDVCDVAISSLASGFGWHGRGGCCLGRLDATRGSSVVKVSDTMIVSEIRTAIFLFILCCSLKCVSQASESPAD